MTFDSAKFAAVVAAAKEKTANSPAWLKAIDKAAAAMVAGELIVTLLIDGALVTSVNGTYHANGHCDCPAAKHGNSICYHRAAARLVELYEAVPEPESKPEPTPAQKAPRIVRSIERDPRNGTRVKVTTCDGWYI